MITYCANCGKQAASPSLPRKGESYFCSISCLRVFNSKDVRDDEGLPFFQRLIPEGYEDGTGFHFGKQRSCQ